MRSLVSHSSLPSTVIREKEESQKCRTARREILFDVVRAIRVKKKKKKKKKKMRTTKAQKKGL